MRPMKLLRQTAVFSQWPARLGNVTLVLRSGSERENVTVEVGVPTMF